MTLSTASSMSSFTDTFTETSTVTLSNNAIEAYNRGPLTKIYTPPNSCTSILTYGSDMSDFYYGHWGDRYYDTACYPPTTLTSSQNAWGLYFHSPALCPDGWSTAEPLTDYQTGWHSDTRMPHRVLSIGPETTAGVCCPTGYFYDSQDGLDHICYSVMIKGVGDSIVYKAPKTNENKNWIETDTKTSTGMISETVWGDGLPVWHQQSDLALFAAASSTSSSVSGSTTITTSSSSISPSSTSLPATASPSTSGAATQTADAANRGKDSGDGGLSTGGIIAICIVIPATVMVVAIFGFYFYYTRKKRRLAEQGIGEQNIAAAEKYNNGGAPEQRPLELGTFPPSPYQSPHLHHSYTSQTAPQEIGDRYYEANYPPDLTPPPRSG